MECSENIADNRGFMTANGQPDNPRSARYILKDFVNGKLLYAHAPPGVDQDTYHSWPKKQKVHSANRVMPSREARAIKVSKHAKFFLSLFRNLFIRTRLVYMKSQ